MTLHTHIHTLTNAHTHLIDWIKKFNCNFSRWNFCALCMTHNIRFSITYAYYTSAHTSQAVGFDSTIGVPTALHSMRLRNVPRRLSFDFYGQFRWTWIGLWEHVIDISSKQSHSLGRSVSNHWTKFLDELNSKQSYANQIYFDWQTTLEKMKNISISTWTSNLKLESKLTGGMKNEWTTTAELEVFSFFTHRLMRSHDYIITFTDLISRTHRILMNFQVRHRKLSFYWQ